MYTYIYIYIYIHTYICIHMIDYTYTRMIYIHNTYYHIPIYVYMV